MPRTERARGYGGSVLAGSKMSVNHFPNLLADVSREVVAMIRTLGLLVAGLSTVVVEKRGRCARAFPDNFVNKYV